MLLLFEDLEGAGELFVDFDGVCRHKGVGLVVGRWHPLVFSAISRIREDQLFMGEMTMKRMLSAALCGVMLCTLSVWRLQRLPSVRQKRSLTPRARAIRFSVRGSGFSCQVAVSS